MTEQTNYWTTEDGIREISCYPSQEIEYHFEGSNANQSKVVKTSRLEEEIYNNLK